MSKPRQAVRLAAVILLLLLQLQHQQQQQGGVTPTAEGSAPAKPPSKTPWKTPPPPLACPQKPATAAPPSRRQGLYDDAAGMISKRDRPPAVVWPVTSRAACAG